MNASELFSYHPPFFCRQIDHEAALRGVAVCEAALKDKKVAAILCYAAHFHSKVKDEEVQILRLSALSTAGELSPAALNDFRIGCWFMTGEDQWVKAVAGAALEFKTQADGKTVTAKWACNNLAHNCKEWDAALKRLYSEEDYNWLTDS